jgi:hypothetical protein
MEYTPNGKAKLVREKAQLEADLANNPLIDFIKAGMMPTIVEDMEALDDRHSYTTAVEKKIDAAAEYIPEGFKKIGRFLWMTHDQPMYKALRHFTQLSDFTAKYTLYMHLTENGKMDKEQALYESSQAFVNYDSPLHPTVQWLDTYGFMPFTKYFLRIQRVLAKHVSDKPARVLAMAAVDKYLMNVSPVTDAALIFHLGNPLSMGPLGRIPVVEELTNHVISEPIRLLF